MREFSEGTLHALIRIRQWKAAHRRVNTHPKILFPVYLSNIHGEVIQEGKPALGHLNGENEQHKPA